MKRLFQTSNRSICSLVLLPFLTITVFFSLFITTAFAQTTDVEFQWDAVSGADGYKLYYGPTSRDYLSPIDVGNKTNHTLALDPDTYYFAVTAYNNYGESGYSDEVGPITIAANDPPSSGTSSNPPYQQDPGADGIVTIEVENFDGNVSQGDHNWEQVFPADHSGSCAMAASPNTGTTNDTGYEANSPRLDFKVNFVHTGTHFVWVRGIGTSGADDSVHVGLDGTGLTTCDRISSFGTGWTWSKSTMDEAAAKMVVDTVGLHTLNLWMREDGFIIDKLVLTTNASYTPADEGPSESLRSDSPIPAPLPF